MLVRLKSLILSLNDTFLEVTFRRINIENRTGAQLRVEWKKWKKKVINYLSILKMKNEISVLPFSLSLSLWSLHWVRVVSVSCVSSVHSLCWFFSSYNLQFIGITLLMVKWYLSIFNWLLFIFYFSLLPSVAPVELHKTTEE